MASSPFPGSQPYSTTLPMGFGGGTYSSWTSAAAKELYDNIYNSGGNIGMPASWYAMGFKDPSPNDIIAGKGLSATLWNNIQTYTQSSASASDADFVDFLGMGQRPSPTENEFVPTAAQSAADRAATALGLDVRRQQFAEAKFAIEMAASQAPRSSSSGSSRSSGGSSGGGGGGGSSAVDYAAKLGYAQSAGAMELDFARQKMAMELDYLKQKYAMANDPNNPDYAIKREEMAQRERIANEDRNYQRERDQRQEQLARAETTAKLGANPGDAVQREVFLRTGKEPVGTPQSVWTGRPTGGAPTTLSQLMTQLTGAGVFGQAPTLPTGTPTTVPYNTDPMNQPPPPPVTAPPPPAFAFGTQRPRPEITPDGWTRAQEFISGDPQIPGVENPEHIRLRVQNGEAQAKVTPLSSPPPPRSQQAFARANSNARFMRPPPPRFAYGTDEEWAATQKAVQDYYATQSATTPMGMTDYGQIDYRPGAYDYTQFAGMAPTDTIDNPNSYQYGMTVEAAQAQNAAPLNNNAVDYDKQGNPHPVYDTTIMTQAERDAYNIGSLTADRNASGLTQSLYPSMANYKPPADMPAPPSAPPPPGTTATTAPAAPAATSAPQQPAQPAYWGNQALNPGLQTITNSPFVPYASIGNPANVQIMDTATGQYRALRPGEDIPAGATVGVTTRALEATGTGGAPSGATGAPGAATAPPAPQSTVGATGSTTVFKGISLPAPSFDTPDSYGNARVTKPGYVTTPDGGGYYYLMGDGSEVKRPDGSYIYYNPVTKSYMPVTASPTIISSMAQFYKLPQDVQQKILTGQPTGYMLNDRGIDTHIASQMIEQERARIAKERGISPAAVPAQLLEMFANQFFSGLEPGRVYPGGWVSSMMASSYGEQPRMLTEAEFLALPVDQQRSLVDGPPQPSGVRGEVLPPDPLAKYRASVGVYNPGSQNVSAATGPMGGIPTGLFTLPQGEPTSRSFNYRDYMKSDADYQRLYPEFFNQQPQPIAPTPITLTPVGGTGNTPSPATGGTPTAPPAGAPTTPATGGTTTPPPASGGGGGATTPPASTGNAALDQLLAVLSYGGDVYQSIPALQYIMGQLSEGEFNTVTTQDTVVPQLGITLPAPGKLNYQMLNNVKQNSPGSFELLKSLFAAGNRDLENEMMIVRQAAPLGSAFEGSLIQT